MAAFVNVYSFEKIYLPANSHDWKPDTVKIGCRRKSRILLLAWIKPYKTIEVIGLSKEEGQWCEEGGKTTFIFHTPRLMVLKDPNIRLKLKSPNGEYIIIKRHLGMALSSDQLAQQTLTQLKKELTHGAYQDLKEELMPEVEQELKVTLKEELKETLQDDVKEELKVTLHDQALEMLVQDPSVMNQAVQELKGDTTVKNQALQELKQDSQIKNRAMAELKEIREKVGGLEEEVWMQDDTQTKKAEPELKGKVQTRPADKLPIEQWVGYTVQWSDELGCPVLEDCTFDLEKMLGEGAHGAVYDLQLMDAPPLVAKKVLMEEQNYEAACKVMEDEAKLMSILADTNCIPKLYGIAYKRDMMLIMSKAEGSHYNDFVDNTVCPRVALKTCLNLCLGFDKIHRKGLIHNDIKEDNVMVTDTGEVTILDLGLMRPSGQPVWSEPTFLTTIIDLCKEHHWYCPTIQFGGPCSPKTDVYSLSFLLGRPMFKYDLFESCADLNKLICRSQMMLKERPSLQEIAQAFDHAMKIVKCACPTQDCMADCDSPTFSK